MSIISITPGQTGLVGVLPSLAYINTNDTIATVTTTGYLNKEVANGIQFSLPCMASVSTQATPTSAPVVNWYQVVHVSSNWSLIGLPVDGTFALPNGQILVGNVSGIATAVTMSGAATLSNTGVLTLASSIASAAGQNFTNSTASATPGTIRAIRGLETSTNATVTSGNLVGVRGEVDMVGASGGFFYGTQGKVIPTGTLSGSSWTAGVFGQFDLSAATINAGQTAPVWADYGASGGTFTNATGMRMFSGTNTIASLTLFAMDYRYGKATNLLELDGSSSTYISSGGAGTLSGTIQKIAISIDGTTYYIPCATVIS